MSYPSVNKHLATLGTTPETATDKQMEQALLLAFQEDLPLGWAKVTELVEKCRTAAGKVMLSLDPKSVEGGQYTRLLAPDIPRRVLEKHFGVAFGFYNCCGGVAAPDKDGLKLSLREQIAAQHPNFVDC